MENNKLAQEIFDVSNQINKLLIGFDPTKKAGVIQSLTLLLMKQNLDFYEQVEVAQYIAVKTIENKNIQLTSI